MSTFLKSLIPRLKQFGQELNKVEELVDKTWIHIDENNNFISYRFLRDRTLLITIEGKVEEGSYSYLPPDSLYLRFGEEKLMFSHNFIIDGLLVLRKQASSELPFILYNPQVVTDGDVHEYLKGLFIKNHRLAKLEKEGVFYFSNYSQLNSNIGKNVYDENFEPVKHASIDLNHKKLLISQGVVEKEYYKSVYNTDSGIIEVLSASCDIITAGDLVYRDRTPANETFKIQKDRHLKSIAAKNGIIVSIKQKTDWASITFAGLLIGFLIFVTILILINSER